MSSFLTIDGSQGEGGGQILRSSLALSMATGRPVHLARIRAGRAKPGLMRQHLACVLAAQKVCQAKVEGAAIGSTELRFTPGKIQAGDYAFAVGSAGSAILVLQTVLPALMLASGPSTVVVEGGTHNPLAPPFDHFARAFLPQVEKMGPKVTATLERHGFMPAGGGKVVVAIAPAKKLSPLALLERGEPGRMHARALVAGGLSAGIARKQLALFAEATGWGEAQLEVVEVAGSVGPGNAFMAEVEHAAVTEVFTGFGAFDVSSRKVVDEVARPLRKYLACAAPVGEHLADQLLLPMALAAMHGGRSEFRTRGLSPHATTHAEIVKAFLGLAVETVKDGEKSVRVTVG